MEVEVGDMGLLSTGLWWAFFVPATASFLVRDWGELYEN